MQKKNSLPKTNSGASVWIGTGQVSNAYFNDKLELEPEIISDMLRNAGGTNALRNLANTCVILPMINNGIGISPEYRAAINQLNSLAKKNPEWFNEDMWIEAFHQIINGLEASGGKQLFINEKKGHEVQQPTPHTFHAAESPVEFQQQSNNQAGSEKIIAHNDNINAFEERISNNPVKPIQYSGQTPDTLLKNKFKNF